MQDSGQQIRLFVQTDEDTFRKTRIGNRAAIRIGNTFYQVDLKRQVDHATLTSRGLSLEKISPQLCAETVLTLNLELLMTCDGALIDITRDQNANNSAAYLALGVMASRNRMVAGFTPQKTDILNHGLEAIARYFVDMISTTLDEAVCQMVAMIHDKRTMGNGQKKNKARVVPSQSLQKPLLQSPDQGVLRNDYVA